MDKHARNGNTVSYIPRIAMKHQNSDIALGGAIRSADVERRELLIVWGRDHQVFEIC
jgi:hypothetical protein